MSAATNKFAFTIKPQNGPLRDSHFIDVQLPWMPALGMTIVAGFTAFEVESIAYWADSKSFRVSCKITSSCHDDLHGNECPLSREETASQLRQFADSHK